MSSTPIAQQQLQYEKLTNELLAKQQLEAASIRHKSKVRWILFFIGLLFFFISRYVVLKTEYKQVFDVFKSGKNADFQCLYKIGDGANAWNIVLNNAYPELVHNNWLFQTLLGFISPNSLANPLSQDQAIFLYNAIRSNYFPNQQQIDQNPACNGLGLTPLSYVCGNILGDWAAAVFNNDTNAALTAMKTNPDQSPWQGMVSTTSCILLQPDLLQDLTTGGFWKVAQDCGTKASPHDIYVAIFGRVPPPQGCSSTQKFGNIATSMATFAMAGSAAGGYGAIAGAGAGLALGLSGATSGCGGGGGCSIM